MTKSLRGPGETCPVCQAEIRADVNEGLCPRCLLGVIDAPDVDVFIGRQISHYRIVEQVSSGGMGVVYKAEDTRFDRLVAVKLLREEIGDALEARARFKREALAVATLHHPNICAFLDFGEHEDQSFLVTELLEGETLNQRIARGLMPESDILNFTQQILEGLKVVHSKGFVHRDMKPSNIFITLGGEVKLLDFGLSKPLEWNATLEASLPTVTVAGSVAGTIPYMSPEQLQGKSVDSRSDLFSTGVVVYEMAAGKRPFDSDSPAETIAAVQREDPDAKAIHSRLGPEFGQWLSKLLRKKSDERFRDAGEALDELEKIRSGQALSAKHRRRAAGLAAAIAIGLLSVSAAPRLSEWWAADGPEPDALLSENWKAQPIELLVNGGLFYLERRTPESFKTAVELCTLAINRDPSFAPAWACRAHVYVVSGTSGYADEPLVGRMQLARLDVEEALRLDPNNAEAYAVRAMIRMSRDRDWEGAASDFDQPLGFDSDFAEAHHWYALFLAAQGELEAALEEVELAEALQPETAVIMAARARIHYYRREFEQAEDSYLAALDREPESVPVQLGLILLYLQQGRHLDAFIENVNHFSIGIEDFRDFLAKLGQLIEGGRRRAGEGLLSEWARGEGRLLSAMDFAVLHASFGRVDATLEWLDQAADQQDDYLNYLKVDPLFDHIRDDPRYEALLERLALSA